jgi:ubiquinone/menaquinone biosynthesis C-methylase UbiE
MKVEWDYTQLADAYLKRPDYSKKAIEEMLSIAEITKGDTVCDVGAGTAHLTLMLAENGLDVHAVEPNDAMRNNGIMRTRNFPNVTWSDGTGENTGRESDFFHLVTFGSSFNVTDRRLALKESHRILKKGGWFACMWNHRDLTDPIQTSIENIIKTYIKNYDYGTRREDQTEIIQQSGLFHPVKKISGNVFHQVTIQDCVEGWKSHATLHRQAGEHFESIITAIDNFLQSKGTDEITIPYTTNLWMAQVIK